MRSRAKRLTLSSLLAIAAFAGVAQEPPATEPLPATAAEAPASEALPAAAPALPAVAPEEQIHNELRALRDGIFAAWQKRDVEALLQYVAPNAVITWQNAEVSRGHAGIRKFYEEVMAGPEPLVTDIQSSLKVDELSILYGSEAAIAFGSIHDDMTLGRKIARAPFLETGRISLDSRWTATAIKLDGQWKLAGYHVSLDAFANPIVAKTIEVGKKLAMLAGAIGVLIGGVLAWMIARRRAPQTAR